MKALDVDTGLHSSSTATVHIVLLDVNDKEPVFQKQEYVFPLPAEPNEGYEIGEVKVNVILMHEQIISYTLLKICKDNIAY